MGYFYKCKKNILIMTENMALKGILIYNRITRALMLMLWKGIDLS